MKTNRIRSFPKEDFDASELERLASELSENGICVMQENDESYNRGFRDGVRAALELRRS